MLINDVFTVDSCSGLDRLCASNYDTMEVKADPQAGHGYTLATKMKGESHRTGIISKGEWSQSGDLWSFIGERVESTYGYHVVTAAWDSIKGLFSVQQYGEMREGTVGAATWQSDIGARHYTLEFTGHLPEIQAPGKGAPVQVPEPDIVALMAISLIGVAAARWLRSRSR